MEWGQVVTIIFGVAGFMAIFMFLINRRIDSVEKRVDDIREEVKELRQEIRELRRETVTELKEIRDLLYKVLGAEKR